MLHVKERKGTYGKAKRAKSDTSTRLKVAMSAT